MFSTWFFLIVQLSVIASGLVSGVFLTFSDFVMKALAAAEPAGGIESMQMINRKVYRSLFMVLLLGMSALSPALIAYAYFYIPGMVSFWIIAGAAIYLFGVFFVTVFFNVPMNKRLDVMDYASEDAILYWIRYVPRWSFWNDVRTFSSGLSAVFFLTASGIWLS